MRRSSAVLLATAVMLAGCAGADEDPEDAAPAEPAAVVGPFTIPLAGCLSINGYVPLREQVYDTGNYSSQAPGLTAVAGFQQAVKVHPFTCSGAMVDGADTGPLSGAFVGVHIEDVAEVHSVRPSDGDGVFLPLQIVLSPGPVHDVLAALGFPVVDGSADVQLLPAGRTAIVDGAAGFSMVASGVEPETDLTVTGFAGEDMFVGPSGWLSLFADCTGPTGTHAVVVESGSSILQEAGPVLQGSNSQDYVCDLELIFTPY